MYFAIDYDPGEYEIFYFNVKDSVYDDTFTPKGVKRIIKWNKRSNREFEEWLNIGLLDKYILENERQVIKWLFDKRR
jgi:hypothetical protein